MTHVETELDAVIFSDWSLIGPDPGNLCRHLSMRRHAEHDQAVSVLRSIRDGSSRLDLANLLRRHKTIEGVAGTTLSRSEGAKFEYHRMRALHAGTLLKHLKASSLSDFTAKVNLMRNIPRTRIQRTLPVL
jgi:hypothetical protein